MMTEMPSEDRESILIVDDTVENIEVLFAALNSRYRVRFATGGVKALQMAAADPLPDLILLDVMMPEMDGYEVCRRLKADPKTREIPVIFVTAMREEKDESYGLELGAVDYITKPISQPIVLARIRTHLELRRVVAEQQDANARLQTGNEELSRTLEALKATQQELVRSEKLASLGAIVAGVAHELNTPIGNAMIVATTMLDEACGFAKSLPHGIKRSQLEGYVADMRKASDLVVRNLNRAAEMIASFKQVAVDQTSSQRRSFDLATAISEVLFTLRPSLKKTPYAVSADIPKSIVMDSFPGPLGQVVTNLVNNAVLHAFEGQEAGQVLVQAQQLAPDRVEIAVSDNGKGIKPEHIERVFDPFFTTKLGQGGSGLGLNIAYVIATEILGGKIAVHSEAGRGTTVTLKLPVEAPRNYVNNAWV